jgi:ABC-type molybdate transport system substrate-binding protein
MAGPAMLLFLAIAAPALGANSAQDQSVSVLYAGSLATVMENGIGPAFVKSTGYTYQGEAQGSLGAAQMVRNHLRSPDVFISADPLVNVNLLMGPQNENLTRWYVLVAASQLVIAYNPHSRFAAKFEDAAANKIPWYEVLATPMDEAIRKSTLKAIEHCLCSDWRPGIITEMIFRSCWANLSTQPRSSRK